MSIISKKEVKVYIVITIICIAIYCLYHSIIYAKVSSCEWIQYKSEPFYNIEIVGTKKIKGDDILLKKEFKSQKDARDKINEQFKDTIFQLKKDNNIWGMLSWWNVKEYRGAVNDAFGDLRYNQNDIGALMAFFDIYENKQDNQETIREFVYGF